MLGFPVSRANFVRIAGMNSIESQSRQFIPGALFSAQQTLQASFDGQTLGSGSGAQLGFLFGMDADAHVWLSPVGRDCNAPIPACHCVRAVGTLQPRAEPATSRLSLTCPFRPRKICHQ